MTDAPTVVKPTENAFLTKEALTSGARFKPMEEDSLHVPELGGTLGLRGLSFKQARKITAKLGESTDPFSVGYTALALSLYVKEPQLSQDEWTKVLSREDFPDTAFKRINRKIGELMAVTDEEEVAVADEFR